MDKWDMVFYFVCFSIVLLRLSQSVSIRVGDNGARLKRLIHGV